MDISRNIYGFINLSTSNDASDPNITADSLTGGIRLLEARQKISVWRFIK